MPRSRARRLLRAQGGTLLLADPPNRTAHNRERFMQLLGGASGSSPDVGGSNPAGSRNAGGRRFVLQECGVVTSCRLDQLDKEMAGGLVTGSSPTSNNNMSGHKDSEVVPVQLAVFQSTVGGDTIGLKP